MTSETIEHIKTVAIGALVFAVFAVVFCLAGCACTSCRADVQASPQTQSSPQSQATPRPWRGAPRAPEPNPGSPRNAFETPPSDGGPDPTAPIEPPPAPPAPPAPTGPAPTNPPAPAPAPGKARMSSTAETENGNIITSNSGTIYLNSPGASPGAAPASSLVMTTPQIATYPILPGPLPDSQAIGLGKRLAGGLFYLATGHCPTKPAAVVPASTAYLAVPQTTVAMVPVSVPTVQAMPMVMQQPAPVVMQAPAPMLAPVHVQASPQAFYAAPAADPAKKCWFFNKCK
jgi:hypothetical protein